MDEISRNSAAPTDSNQAPRILFVISTLGAGGAERVASSMLNYWAGCGRDVGLMTLGTSQSDHYQVDSRVQRISLDIFEPSTSIWHAISANVRRLRLLRMQIKAFQPDVVISFIDATNILVLAALLGTGLPVIVSERVDPRQHHIRRGRRIARRLLYPRAWSLVVQTEAVAGWARHITHPSRVHTIPNPVGPLPGPNDPGSRQKQILGVGRLTHQKGFDILISAFAASQAPARGWTLTIVGDGDARAELQALAQRLGVDHLLHMPGVSSDPWQYMNDASIYVLASRFEGFPNALLEAMAMGCAVIATDCPSGPAEIVKTQTNGLMIEADNPRALQQALDALIDQPERRTQLAVMGLRVRERYAIDKIMARWDELVARAATGSHDASD